jgi:hypothetical protein
MDFGKKIQRFNDKGQNILEFALILPFLIIVLFGVLDLGRVFFASINLTNAAREAVRFLTLHPDDIANEYIPYWGSKKAAIEEAGYSGISLNESDVIVDCPDVDNDDFCDSGNPATVEVTYDFELVLGWIIPSPITVTRTAVMIVP